MQFSEQNYKFMYQALIEAEQAFDEGEVPIGAVVVQNDRIIGTGYNQIEKLNDATAHAEIIAITAAMNNLHSKFLLDCDIYVTIEPCLMCVGALKLARIRTIYFSANEPKFGACGSIYNIGSDGKYNHSIKTYSGIFEKESSELMKKFFKMNRLSEIKL